MTTNRYSCKCKLCKSKWTSELSDRVAVAKAHADKCELYRTRYSNRRKLFPSQSEDSEHYQMSCMYMTHIQITGHFNAEVKCDGRCTSATGHNCECSCGGKNHGMSAAA